MKRKWRENEEMEKKGTDNEEMERDLLSIYPHFLFISPLSIHFQIKNCLILSQNVKYGTFVADFTKKHMRYEKMILGQICCEKAPQVVRAWAQAVLGLFQNNNCLNLHVWLGK